MKKAACFIILLFFIGIYLISAYNPIMKKIAPFRYALNSPFGADNYRFGDLFGFSYLSDFKIKEDKGKINIQPNNLKKNINFYCVCDSYLWSFPFHDSVLFGVDKYYQSRWTYDEFLDENLDTSKINFLMIEMAEWYSKDFLSDSTDIYSRIKVKTNTGNNSFDNQFKFANSQNKPNADFLTKFNKAIANKWINRNLEFNLFDYSFLTFFKELKANLNYKLFDRINSDIELSQSREYLFYKPTIDTNSTQSTFRFISDEEVVRMVNKINEIYYYYKAKGFDYIYFSIIPKPVTIIEPDRMPNNNQLIQRIQNNKNLKAPVIDAYSILKKIRNNAYQKSDTHWTPIGFNLWVSELNNILKKLSK
ncbi:hypothetical protein BH10BAC5_BH10BAC5_06830 [soil metagenome]